MKILTLLTATAALSLTGVACKSQRSNAQRFAALKEANGEPTGACFALAGANGDRLPPYDRTACRSLAAGDVCASPSYATVAWYYAPNATCDQLPASFPSYESANNSYVFVEHGASRTHGPTGNGALGGLAAPVAAPVDRGAHCQRVLAALAPSFPQCAFSCRLDTIVDDPLFPGDAAAYQVVIKATTTRNAHSAESKVQADATTDEDLISLQARSFADAVPTVLPVCGS